ncbi:MAG: tetratricopeptide repeat protein [Elusimicrobia bacterium]|nr:tetratricopeptide repeat protein [Elusimicrobiota bacterium]
MRRRFLFFSLFVFSASVFGAGQKAFEQGNKAYQTGDFNAAKENYERAVAEGNGGLALSYNLGNTYYRLGKMGLARLWFERALESAPRDDDARYNRDVVRERVGETETDTVEFQGLSGALWIAVSAANLLFFLLLALGLYRETEWIWWGRWVLGLLFAIFLIAALAAQRQMSVRYGVVIVDRAEARTGPSAQEQVGFVAPEGHQVVILDRLNDWVQIGVPTKGLKGWVSGNTVEHVRPSSSQVSGE